MTFSELIAEFGPLATAAFAAVATYFAWKTARTSEKLHQNYLAQIDVEGTFYDAMVSIDENRIEKNLLILDLNNMSFHANQIKEIFLGKRKLKFFQVPEDLRGIGGHLRLEFSGNDAEEIVKNWNDLAVIDCANRKWHPQQPCTKNVLELA